jgi:hypothetical protein
MANGNLGKERIFSPFLIHATINDSAQKNNEIQLNPSNNTLPRNKAKRTRILDFKSQKEYMTWNQRFGYLFRMKRIIKLSITDKIPVSYKSLIKKEGNLCIDYIKGKQIKASYLSKNKRIINLPIYKPKEK